MGASRMLLVTSVEVSWFSPPPSVNRIVVSLVSAIVKLLMEAVDAGMHIKSRRRVWRRVLTEVGSEAMEWVRHVERVVVAGGAFSEIAGDVEADSGKEYVSTPNAITPSCATATVPDTSTLIGLALTDMLPVVGRVFGLLLSIISCSNTPDVRSVPKLFTTLPSTLTTADGTRRIVSSFRGTKGLFPVSPLCTLRVFLVEAAQVDPVTFNDDIDTLIRLRLLPRVTYA